jgi:hypothetical protein
VVLEIAPPIWSTLEGTHFYLPESRLCRRPDVDSREQIVDAPPMISDELLTMAPPPSSSYYRSSPPTFLFDVHVYVDNLVHVGVVGR